MNTVYNMTAVPIYGEDKELAYECTDSLAEAGNGKMFIVPDGITVLVCQVVPTTATAKIQTTVDVMDTVINGTPTWVDWDEGAVSVATQGVCYPPTAIRLVQIGVGSSILSIRAQ